MIPALKAIPLKEPELAHSVGLVTQDRDPSAPLGQSLSRSGRRLFREELLGRAQTGNKL